MTAYQAYDLPLHPTEAQTAKLERHIELAGLAFNVAAHAPHAGCGAMKNDLERHLAGILQRNPALEALPLDCFVTAVRNARNAARSGHRDGKDAPTAHTDRYRVAQKPDRRAIVWFQRSKRRGVDTSRVCLKRVGYVSCDLPEGFDTCAPFSSIEIRKADGQWSLIVRVEAKDPAREVKSVERSRSRQGLFDIKPIILSADLHAE